MTYKTILVYLSTLKNADRLTKAACAVARKFDAHLVGLHTLQSMEVYPGVATYISSDITKSFNQTQKDEAARIEQAFNNVTRKEDFVSEWRCVFAQSTDASDRLVEHARCADLIIMAQPDDTDHLNQKHIIREVIEGSGRPVLIIPKVGDFDKIGDNVLVGWSATKEATRAMHDAIPFFKDGGKANIFWLEKSSDENSYLAHTAREMAACLDRHNVKVNVSRRVKSGVSVGDEILNEVSDTGSDMIVAGAYGHSRVYDFTIGATTPHLIEHMTVPVLFSC